MPTLLNENGFKFFFYANEHLPKHIHVMKGEDFAKIELGTLRVVSSYMKHKDLKMVLKILKKYNSEFERSWDEWFNRS